MLYEFEDYCLDVARQELRRGADLVAVEPQVLDLLHYLIRNRERVVSKDDLIAHVWNGRLVSDSALTSRIATARQAVGDTGHHQRLIRTLARKGVRFVGEVRECQHRDSAGAAVEAPSLALPLPDRPSIAVLPFTNMSRFLRCERSSEGFLDCWDKSSTKRAASSRRAVQHAALLLNNRSHSRLEVDPEPLCSLL